MLMPVILDYVSVSSYGVWVTISSIVGWVYFLDLGMGLELRNRLAESFAKNDNVAARSLISSGYFAVSLMSFVAFILGFILLTTFDISSILNVPTELKSEVFAAFIIALAFFCLQFIVKIVGIVLTADQLSAKAGYLNTISNVITLVVLYILTKISTGSLLILILTSSLITFLVPFIATYYLFSFRYKEIKPSVRYIDKNLIKPLIYRGSRFFLIQIATLIVYSTSSFIISNLFGPEKVAEYDVLNKLFSIVIIFSNIVMTPYWSAFTHAYSQDDLAWIYNSIKTLLKLWVLVPILSTILIIFDKSIVSFWVGDRISVDNNVSIVIAIFVSITSLKMIFTTVVNGLGKLKIQLYTSIFAAIVNLPLCFFFAKLCGLGVGGVIIAPIVALLPDLILTPIQVNKILKNKDKGIWGR